MTFAETLQFVRGLVGKAIDVRVLAPLGEGEPADYATFSGVVDRVDSSPPGRETSGTWRVWLENAPSAPSSGAFLLDEELFEHADVEADTPPAEERGESGLTWTLTIHQRGVLLDVLVYV